MYMNKTVSFLKTIADKNRLLILYLLKQQTLCVCDIQKVIPLTQGALSIQLKSLTTVGLLSYFKQGKWVFYKLSDEIDASHHLILSQLFKDIELDTDVLKMKSQLTISKTCKDC